MKTYYIKNIDCEGCARKIENHISKQAGIETVSISVINQKIIVSDDNITSVELAKLANQVEDGVEVYDEAKSFDAEEEQKGFNFELLAIGVSFGLLILGVVFSKPILFLIGYLIVGYPVVKLAIKNAIHLQFFDEYFLMTVATFAAISIGQMSEALAVMLFYSVGEYIQAMALDNTKLSITKLAKYGTRDALKVVGKTVTKVDIDELQIGDIIRVSTGSKVGVDCKLVSVSGLIDTAHLSGESEPKQITSGDLVYGGSINCGDQIDLEVSALAGDSMIARMIELVTYADAQKTKTEQFITRFSKIYTPIVVALAILIVIFEPLVFGIDQSDAIYRAVTLLVISCPCAFVISVPLGYVRAIGTLAKEHVLVKGSVAIDKLNKIEVLAVDKTGTITTGDFAVVEFVNHSTYPDTFLYSLVASAEQHVVHPIATSLYNYTKACEVLEITDLTQDSGLGLRFDYHGKKYSIIKAQTDEAYTVSNLCEDGVVIATFKLQDEIKPGIKDLVTNLAKRGINVLMLTGDNQKVAADVSVKLGLDSDSVYAELMPEDKLSIVEEQIKSGKVVAFVGDGLNDAAVIKRSDLGIAMGATGSELSIESADIVISDDNISKLLLGLNVSEQANKIIKQNIILAFVVKVIFIILGIIGITTMWEAVFSDVGVTLIAVANSMRIRK